MNIDYKVKYAVLPSRDIFNPIGLDNTLSIWTPQQPYITKYNGGNPFYEKLEASILKEGFRNPILVTAGWINDGQMKDQMPMEWNEDRTKAIWCHRNGGSRLWVAQKHNLDIPCFIAAYNGVFEKAETVNSAEEMYRYYTDKPKDIKLTEYGIKVYNLPQIHLED